ncbi:MAG: MnhB domain-containing protein [Thermodesulfobacteriota bacterium]
MHPSDQEVQTVIARFDDVIIQTVCRLLIPFIQIYGLYVIAHGHGSPGGGFQGGVILGASFILLCLSYDVEEIKKRMSQKGNLLFISLGLIVYSGIGAVCMILGGTYLDYSTLHKILFLNPVSARYMGILGIEVGVGITVMAVMISIFLDLSSFNGNEKG